MSPRMRQLSRCARRYELIKSGVWSVFASSQPNDEPTARVLDYYTVAAPTVATMKGWKT